MYALTEGPADAEGNQFLLARLAHGQVIPGQDSWEPIGQGDLAKVTGQDLPGFYGVYWLEKDPLDENVLFLATSGGLLASRDGGQAWRLLNPAAGRLPVYRVEAAPGIPPGCLSTAEALPASLSSGPTASGSPGRRPQISYRRVYGQGPDRRAVYIRRGLGRGRMPDGLRRH
jgi:hypothetical protein